MKRKIAAVAAAVALVAGGMMWASPAMADDVAPPDEAVVQTDETVVDTPAEPVAEDPAPVVEDPAPVADDPAPVVDEPAPVTDTPTPVTDPEPEPTQPTVEEKVTVWYTWLTTLAEGVTEPHGANDVTWPQTLVGEGQIAPPCGVWYQQDKYYGTPYEIQSVVGDGVLSGLPPEDSSIVKDWEWVYGGDCKPDEVTPTLTWTPPTCDEDGVLTLGEGRWTWSAVLNDDGSTTYTATETEGAIIPEGTQFQWTVPNLTRLPEDSDECYNPIVVTLDQPRVVDECGTENDWAYIPDDTEVIDYFWASDDPADFDFFAQVAKGYTVEEPGDGWVFDGTDETGEYWLYKWDPQFTDVPCEETATLDGSFITPVCVSDAAYLTGTIAIVDPDNQVPDDATATITLTDGTNTFTYPEQFPLGAINVLWPGASVDPVTGRGVTWPGYITNADGTYTATDDPAYFGWTRGGVTIHVEVNPEFETTVDYPPASPLCLTSPPAPPTPPALASTGGGDVSPLIPIGASLASALGLVLFLMDRARRRV